MDVDPHWAWSMIIQPFIEGANIYDAVDPRTYIPYDPDVGDPDALSNPTKLAIMQSEIRMFRCPSDSAPPMNDFRTVPTQTNATETIACSNYVANNGFDSLRWKDYPPAAMPATLSNRGPFTIVPQGQRPTRLGQLLDGTSSTILFSERAYSFRGLPSVSDNAYAANAWMIYGIDADSSSAIPRGMADAMFCGSVPINFFDVANDERGAGASSVHPGGACFSFADGATRMLRDEITWNGTLVSGSNPVAPVSGATYNLALCMDDREVIPAEF
jgi:hypothetical protein